MSTRAALCGMSKKPIIDILSSSVRQGSTPHSHPYSSEVWRRATKANLLTMLCDPPPVIKEERKGIQLPSCFF